MEKMFMGETLNAQGDIEGAIPFFEYSQPVIKAVAENTNKVICEQFMKMNIDPQIVEKQLREIAMLKSDKAELETANEHQVEIIEQKENAIHSLIQQINKMKNCMNCKKSEDTEYDGFQCHCDCGQFRCKNSCYNYGGTEDLWELAG